MKNTLFFVFLAATLLSGCYRYEPQFEGPYEDSADGKAVGAVYEILAVENGKIHLYHPSLKFQKTLDNLPGGIEKAAINFSHSRIAYQIPGLNLVVIDSAGQELATVPNSSNTQSFDWHSNDSTLIFLNGFQLETWGPELKIAPSQLYDVLIPFTASNAEVNAAAVTASGAVAAACRYYDPAFGGYQSRVILSNDFGQIFHLSLYSSETVEWIRCNRSGNRMLVGSRVGGISTPIRSVDATSAFFNEISFGSDPFAAPAPSGNGYAVWNSQLLRVIDTDRGIDQTVDLPGEVTALDW